ncbi:MAG: response regulator transcription factor [Myxococcota bacterium]
MARVLLIDDDAALLDVLALAVQDGGHEPLTAPDGHAGYQAVAQQTPDLVVSDVNMPGIDGFSLCRRLRDDGVTVPIILLTARDGEIDEALGLELGADDYMIKPFKPRILLARIEALLRRERLRTDQEPPERLVQGALELDAGRLEARFAGRVFETTVTEFRLLQALAKAPGIVFSRTQLLEKMRGDDSVVVERLVDTYVRRLRRKIESIDPSFNGIETVIGAGYRWRDS